MIRFDRLFISQRPPYARTFLTGVLLLFVLFSVNSIDNRVLASSISESFNTVNSFEVGQVVSLNDQDPDDIVLANTANSPYLLGVVSNTEAASLNFNKEAANVTVALTGLAEVFVHDAGGSFEKGDFVGASWLEGVGMRANIEAPEQELLGVVQESYDFSGAQNYGEIETSDGKREVKIGSVTVRLFDKETSQAAAASQTDSGLQSYLSSLAGQDVSLTKVLVGSLLFIVSVVIAGVFIANSIRGSFYSIGRNPLASASIHKGMIRVSFLSFGIIFMGAVLSYTVLVI